MNQDKLIIIKQQKRIEDLKAELAYWTDTAEYNQNKLKEQKTKIYDLENENEELKSKIYDLEVNNQPLEGDNTYWVKLAYHWKKTSEYWKNQCKEFDYKLNNQIKYNIYLEKELNKTLDN